jgi:hypothetical protein
VSLLKNVRRLLYAASKQAETRNTHTYLPQAGLKSQWQTQLPSRVARWFIFIPKMPILVYIFLNVLGSENFDVFRGHLVF